MQSYVALRLNKETEDRWVIEFTKCENPNEYEVIYLTYLNMIKALSHEGGAILSNEVWRATELNSTLKEKSQLLERVIRHRNIFTTISLSDPFNRVNKFENLNIYENIVVKAFSKAKDCVHPFGYSIVKEEGRIDEISILILFE